MPALMGYATGTPFWHRGCEPTRKAALQGSQLRKGELGVFSLNEKKVQMKKKDHRYHIILSLVSFSPLHHSLYFSDKPGEWEEVK